VHGSMHSGVAVSLDPAVVGSDFPTEAQTAFKGVVELMVAGIIKPEYLLAKAAINWAADRFGIKYLPEAKAATKKAEKAQPAQPAKVPEFDGSHIANYGELWSRCKNYGMTKAEGLKLASIKDQFELTDLDEAWKTIFDNKFRANMGEDNIPY